MSGGSRWNPGEDIQNFGNRLASNPLDTFAEVFVEGLSGGFAHYQDGKITDDGMSTNMWRQGLQALNGTNANINAQRATDEQIARQEAEREKERQERLRRQQISETEASRAGASLRKGLSGTGGSLSSSEANIANEALGL